MGYTILDVSRSTGINESTIKAIEKGKCFPQFDTLYMISSLYKTDLVSLFVSSLSDFTIINFMNQISSSSANGDLKSLEHILRKIESYLESYDLTSLVQKDYHQIRAYTKGLIFALKTIERSEKASHLALKYYEKSLKIGNPNFSFTCFTHPLNALDFYLLKAQKSLLTGFSLPIRGLFLLHVYGL